MSIWLTAFVMNYLEMVLEEYKSEWESAHNKASQWIDNQLEFIEIIKPDELYSTCKQYLIEAGIMVFNQGSKIIVNRFDINEEGRSTICEKLKSLISDDDVKSLLNSQMEDGQFVCNKITAGSFQVSFNDLKTLKRYVNILGLRRIDDDVWVTSFVVIYLETILDDHKSEWYSFHKKAKSWISKKVYKPELEKSLYDACDQYLMKRGFEFYTENN